MALLEFSAEIGTEGRPEEFPQGGFAFRRYGDGGEQGAASAAGSTSSAALFHFLREILPPHGGAYCLRAEQTTRRASEDAQSCAHFGRKRGVLRRDVGESHV